MKGYYCRQLISFLIFSLFLSACDKNDNHQVITFKGYSCISDCSGHKAGYAWAAKKGIRDPSDCGGKSSSFIEGCQSFASEQ
jgi:hypothetical protein